VPIAFSFCCESQAPDTLTQGEFKEGEAVLVDFDGEALTFTRVPAGEKVTA
jgi:hypothetical protein